MDTINVNEALKLIAAAKERINKYIENNDINDENYLIEAELFLTHAIDKLVIPKPNCS